MPTDLPERIKPAMSQRARDFYCGAIVGIIGTLAIVLTVVFLLAYEMY